MSNKVDKVNLKTPLIPQTKKRKQARIPTLGDAHTLEILTGIGLGIHAIARDLDTSHDSLERWIKEYPEMERARNKGIAKRQKRAYACYFQQAFPVDEEGRPTAKGDPGLMTFWMRTRERWKEPTKDINLTTSPDAPCLTYALKKEVVTAVEKTDRKTK